MAGRINQQLLEPDGIYQQLYALWQFHEGWDNPAPVETNTYDANTDFGVYRPVLDLDFEEPFTASILPDEWGGQVTFSIDNIRYLYDPDANSTGYQRAVTHVPCLQHVRGRHAPRWE